MTIEDKQGVEVQVESTETLVEGKKEDTDDKPADDGAAATAAASAAAASIVFAISLV